MVKPTRYLYILVCGHSRKSEKKYAEWLYCLDCDKKVRVVLMKRSLFAVGEEF